MAARQPQQMCVLRIGFMTLVLPASKGMKAMQELQGAVEADWDLTSSSNRYMVKERPDLQLTLIDADQVVMPGATTASSRKRSPRLLSHD